MMPKKPRANRPSGTMPVAPLLPKRIGAGDVVTDLTRTMRAQAPEEQAQALIDQAWEARTQRQAAALARRALEIFPDCADAYNVLAGAEARSAEDALVLYEHGVDAGRRSLGNAFFDEHRGHFWGMIETRPYLRARRGLADCLWALGRKRESITHCEALLELNPDDNQGIRHGLLSRYLALGNDMGAARLFRDYPHDASAAFLWSRVLLDLRRGDQVAATEHLVLAMHGNPHVAGFFAGKRKPPARLPAHYSPGDRNEAALYIANFAEAWLASADAMDWLTGQLAN
jgi:tetratricopeptide (TPR) repeat protein